MILTLTTGIRRARLWHRVSHRQKAPAPDGATIHAGQAKARRPYRGQCVDPNRPFHSESLMRRAAGAACSPRYWACSASLTS